MKNKTAKKGKRTKEVVEIEKTLGLLGFKDMPIPTNKDEAIKYNKAVFNYFLKKVKATRVEIRYDGGGDNGQIESVTVYKPKPNGEVGEYGQTEDEVDVSGIEVEIYSIDTEYCSNTKGGWKTSIKKKKDKLEVVLDQFAYDLLATQHFDWVNNEGGYGTLEYDVAENKFSMNHNQRTTESISAEW
jgi:hypothetical protein